MTSLINRDLMRSRVSTEVVPTLHRLVTAAEAIAENNPFGIPPPATDGPTIVSPHPMSQVVLAMATLRSKCTLAARPLTGLARSAYSQVKVYENVLDCLRDARNGKPPSGPFDADFLFLGTTQLVQLVDGARALEGYYVYAT